MRQGLENSEIGQFRWCQWWTWRKRTWSLGTHPQSVKATISVQCDHEMLHFAGRGSGHSWQVHDHFAAVQAVFLPSLPVRGLLRQIDSHSVQGWQLLYFEYCDKVWWSSGSVKLCWVHTGAAKHSMCNLWLQVWGKQNKTSYSTPGQAVLRWWIQLEKLITVG